MWQMHELLLNMAWFRILGFILNQLWVDLPCFLLSSPGFDFPSRFFSIAYILSTTIISISLSLQVVLLAPINSCSLLKYLVLSFLLMNSSSGLSTGVFFPNETNINTHCMMEIFLLQ